MSAIKSLSSALSLALLAVFVVACGGGGGGSKSPPPPPPLPAGSVALSGSAYTVSESAGLLTIQVDRAAGSRDATVAYATSDGSAVAGTDYTARSGTLSWDSGDTSSKAISLPINPNAANLDSKSFTITLSNPTNGVTLGTPAVASVSITSTAPATRSITVKSNRLVDASGNIVQLRGVSFIGFEFVPIAGFNPGDPSGGQGGQPGGPKWSAIKAWHANTIRITLNESSWLGLTCVDTDGVTRVADPGANYHSALATQIQQAISAGLYVILSLHYAAPGNQCPMVQTQMANADHSIAFWTSVANTFKDNTSVMFELYNEPFFYALTAPTDEWKALMNGATFSYFPATSGTSNYKNINGNWTSVGMQQMLDAIRATGATNVVLIGGTEFGNNMSGWLANMPHDSINQIVAEWHPYPPIQYPQTVAVSAGGSGYAVGDKITLVQPNTVYSPVVMQVTSIGTAGAVTGVTVTDKGRYLMSALPTAPVPQGSTTGSGTGATFALSGWYNLSSPWSMPTNWPTVTALAAKVPVVLSELGEHNAAGTQGSPFLQQLLPFAGQNNLSVIGCCWDVFMDPDNVLIKDVNGTPTDGYGVVFHDWMTGVAWQ